MPRLIRVAASFEPEIISDFMTLSEVPKFKSNSQASSAAMTKKEGNVV